MGALGQFMSAMGQPTGAIGGMTPMAVGGGNPGVGGYLGELGGKIGNLNPFGNSSDWGHEWAKSTHGPQPPTLQGFAPVGAPQQVNPGFTAVPQSAGATISPQDMAFRQNQSNLANHLMLQATGQSPSIAAMQTQDAMGQNIAGQFALANSNQGSNHGAAVRNAMNQVGNMGGQLAVQSGLARLAEQQQASGQLGNVLQGARGQDLEQAIGQAQLSQGNNQFNAGMTKDITQMNTNAAMANQMAGLKYQDQLMNQTAMQNQQLLQKYGIQNQAFGGMASGMGGALSMLGSLFGGKGGSPGGGNQPNNPNGGGGGDSGTGDNGAGGDSGGVGDTPQTAFMGNRFGGYGGGFGGFSGGNSYPNFGF